MSTNLQEVNTGSAAKGLKLKRIGIDTHQDLIVFLKKDNFICRAEGFASMSRVRVSTEENSIIASLNVITNGLLAEDEVGLSEAAWRHLNPMKNDTATISHTRPVDSFAAVRGKLFGNDINQDNMYEIIKDIVAGRYTQIQLSAFILACLADQLNLDEMCSLTSAMVKTGDKLIWPQEIIVDKHCVGGLPGNRTTPIVVAVVAACGLTMPKTSSRAITSPAGTADTMETITTVSLSLEQMRKVVEKEGACLAWGGTVNFSPSDDKLIQIERALELDSEGQMVASILSKKLAAGATHVVIDIPVGPTAKVRSHAFAKRLAKKLISVGIRMNLVVKPFISDGTQPVGRGIGPALEMLDIIDVLQNKPDAPQDLKERAVKIAGEILEMAEYCKPNEGKKHAQTIIKNGQAWQKFQAICIAQGGIKEIPKPICKHEILAPKNGIVCYFNNRFISRLAKLAGAPNDKAAGLKFHIKLGDKINKGDKMFTIFSESQGELQYALNFLNNHPDEIRIEDEIV
tara:strand:- start:55753 stop:57294 length:1542 start_codon:yes stop_codon:yes gene_type:complete